MNEQVQMIAAVADRLFSDQVDKKLLDAAESGVAASSLWQSLVDTGFHEIGSEASGTGYEELFALLSLVGKHAVPLPLAEVMLANAWAGSARGISSIGMIDGALVRAVPWGRIANRVIGLRPGSTEIRVYTAFDVSAQGANLAGEPRDDIAPRNEGLLVSLAVDPELLLTTSRAVQMSGALARVLEMSLTYASEREQFGRTISKFQTIQHSLAVMAAEVAAAQRAADAAVAALSSDQPVIDVAAAKSRMGESVGVVTELAHQVHGAMGFTYEHKLHHFTRRLWAWRDEYGNETLWQERLGRALVKFGADGIWPFIASR